MSVPAVDQPTVAPSREWASAPVSASDGTATTAEPTGTAAAASEGDLIRVAIVGATGYVGAELIRLLARHPNVEIVGLVGRGRQAEPIESIHPHLGVTGLTVSEEIPDDAEAVFLALPHGASAERVPTLLERGIAIIDMGADFRLHDPADYPVWYGFEHPSPSLLAEAVYGLPELHRAGLQGLAKQHARGDGVIVASPGCYPTTTILALAPLADAGLIGDLVVDAKSGVSGAGRDPKPDMHFSEVDESVKAYGVFTHRHTAEIEQELGGLGPEGGNPGAKPIDFLPHLIPMTRGILSACHVRPTRPVTQSELDELYRATYADERFVRVVSTPPATKHVLGSNEIHVHARVNERTSRILTIGVLDNLVKGAAGQGVQAFNIVHGLSEDEGLRQLPLSP